MKRTAVHAAVIAALSATAGLLVAGPLSPPAGPITPMYKTLAEVQPRTALSTTNTPGDAGCVFRISQRGSFYLTGNITGIAGKASVVIAADGVTLDLNGFSIVGGDTGVQVVAPGGISRVNTAVHNGTISGCSGIGLNAAAADYAAIEGIQVTSCTGLGISVGASARIRECTAVRCSYGVWAGTNCRVSDCETNGNTISGIAIHDRGMVENCTSSSNTLRGIDTWNDVTIRGCTISNNGENGLDGLDNTVIDACTVAANGGIGIHAGIDSVVTACVVGHNGGNGIEVGSGRVRDCTSNNNTYGIAVTGDTGTRIEGNTVSNCRIGIYTTGMGCLAVRNIGHNHTDAFILMVGGESSMGPIVFANGQSVDTTNPWTNLYQ